MVEKLTKYLEYLNVEKRYSTKTIENYNIDLSLFVKFLKENNIDNFNIVSYDDLRKFLEFLYKKNYSNKTISRHISSLKSFFKYLVNNEYINNNPTDLLSLPKMEFRLPKYLTIEELEKILSTAKENKKTSERDLLILEIFYSTGIRLSELSNIKIEDIDNKNRTIIIKGKGNKERYVFYSRECSKCLKNYLENNRNALNIKGSNYLFLSTKGNQLTPAGIEYIVNNIFIHSGINTQLTPHVLRHTFATHMLNEGANLMTVKELLGHSNIATTGIYTHVSNEQLRRTYLSSHPRARKDK